MHAPLQSQPIAAQHRIQVERSRIDAIPSISRSEQRIDALYMRGQIVGGATNQAVKMFEQPFTPLRVGMVGI